MPAPPDQPADGRSSLAASVRRIASAADAEAVAAALCESVAAVSSGRPALALREGATLRTLQPAETEEPFGGEIGPGNNDDTNDLWRYRP